MGPCWLERGNLLEHRPGRARPHASMGPRSGERGNGQSGGTTLVIATSLQWGRARDSAEIKRTPVGYVVTVKLQWGRARGSAEIGGAEVVTTDGIMLQWGRARGSAEISLYTANRPSMVPLQWGRARRSAEMW